jgi:hypothetical protein
MGIECVSRRPDEDGNRPGVVVPAKVQVRGFIDRVVGD